MTFAKIYLKIVYLSGIFHMSDFSLRNCNIKFTSLLFFHISLVYEFTWHSIAKNTWYFQTLTFANLKGLK